MKKNKIIIYALLSISLLILHSLYYTRRTTHPIILMTDFGLRDVAAGVLKGVILSVDNKATIVDLSHNIEPFNIQEASYRLLQVFEYCPKNSIFVTVIDPGVGTNRRSIAAKFKNGHIVIGPDNGIITHIARTYGIDQIRCIDEKNNRLKKLQTSDTFHGRDIYAFTAARLASHTITFESVGPVCDDYVQVTIQDPITTSNGAIGTIVVLDVPYGNLWTNISLDDLQMANILINSWVTVEIYRSSSRIYSGRAKYCKTFGQVPPGDPIVYINSIGNIGIGLNQNNFAQIFNIKPGDIIHINTSDVIKSA